MNFYYWSGKTFKHFFKIKNTNKQFFCTARTVFHFFALFKIGTQVLATPVVAVDPSTQPEMIEFPAELTFEQVPPGFAMELTLFAMKITTDHLPDGSLALGGHASHNNNNNNNNNNNSTNNNSSSSSNGGHHSHGLTPKKKMAKMAAKLTSSTPAKLLKRTFGLGHDSNGGSGSAAVSSVAAHGHGAHDSPSKASLKAATNHFLKVGNVACICIWV